MDNSIRPGANVRRPYAQRDLLPVRAAAEAELDTPRTAAAPDWEHGRRDGANDGNGNGRHDAESHSDHALTGVVVDPETESRLFRERDIRTECHCYNDQAMLVRRAYGHSAAADGAQPNADIEA